MATDKALTKAEACKRAVAVVMEFDHAPAGLSLAVLIMRELLAVSKAENEACAEVVRSCKWDHEPTVSAAREIEARLCEQA